MSDVLHENIKSVRVHHMNHATLYQITKNLKVLSLIPYKATFQKPPDILLKNQFPALPPQN